MLPHELYVAIQAFLARLRAKMHVTLRGLARTLQATSLRVPRGALRVTLRVPREASRAAYVAGRWCITVIDNNNQ